MQIVWQLSREVYLMTRVVGPKSHARENSEVTDTYTLLIFIWNVQPLFRYMHIVYIQAVGLCANFSVTDVARGNTQCWRFLDAIFQNRRRRWCPIVPRYQQLNKSNNVVYIFFINIIPNRVQISHLARVVLGGLLRITLRVHSRGDRN